MGARAKVRSKCAVPVHVIRKSPGERQRAYTMDITDVSARLRGLKFLLEPGEVVEILRGPLRSKFEVRWMGAPSTPLEGQAGIQSLEPGKCIWGIHLPQNQPDSVTTSYLPQTSRQEARLLPSIPGSKRWYERCHCNGIATIKTARASFAIYGQIKDISESGVYIEINTPLPVRTEVALELKIENFCIEASGIVRTSYPLIGMGITFKDLTDPVREKLEHLLTRLIRQNGNHEVNAQPAPAQESEPSPAKTEVAPNEDRYRVRVLAMACKTLATNFDTWTRSWHAADIEELRQAVHELQQKLGAVPVFGLSKSPQPGDVNQSATSTGDSSVQTNWTGI